jgi:AraC family transcriptional regulator
MKKATLTKRVQLANDIMFYIYTHIDTDINIDELSHDFGISKFHMHRIFKDAFSKNIYELIKSIRLQKASNLLLTNKYSTISNIGNLCGYSSHSSFIRAFKERFYMSPKEWKNGGYKEFSQKILAQAEHPALFSKADFSKLEPTIVQMPAMKAYYIRHQGYNRSMKLSWQKLYTWVLNNNIKKYQQIGLYHDNPSITPHEECQYIACIITDEIDKIKDNRLPKFTISEGTYAKFDIKGVYGDVLKLIQWIYQEWLPKSDFETTTKPSYAIHKKNHFLSEDGEFDISFYVSIKY